MTVTVYYKLIIGDFTPADMTWNNQGALAYGDDLSNDANNWTAGMTIDTTASGQSVMGRTNGMFPPPIPAALTPATKIYGVAIRVEGSFNLYAQSQEILAKVKADALVAVGRK
jgi:hypothetical protein